MPITISLQPSLFSPRTSHGFGNFLTHYSGDWGDSLHISLFSPFFTSLWGPFSAHPFSSPSLFFYPITYACLSCLLSTPFCRQVKASAGDKTKNVKITFTKQQNSLKQSVYGKLVINVILSKMGFLAMFPSMRLATSGDIDVRNFSFPARWVAINREIRSGEKLHPFQVIPRFFSANSILLDLAIKWSRIKSHFHTCHGSPERRFLR